MKHNLLRWLTFSLVLFFYSAVNSQITFQKTFGGSLDDVANWVANTSTGYLVAGYTTISPNGREGYLLNLDFAGNVIWQKRIGGDKTDQFNVAFETAGGYLVMGQTDTYGEGGDDIWLLKISPAGNILWSKTIGDSNTNDLGNSMIAVPGNRILISGAQAPVGTTGYNSTFFLLDDTGQVLWSQTYESGSIGNLMRTNYVENGVIYASGGAETEGAFLKIDLETGNFISATEYPGNSTEALYYQQPTPDGNLILCDHTWSATNGAQMKQWVNKVTPDGQTIWSKVYSRLNDNMRGRIEAAGDGNFLLTPYDGSFTGNGDALLAKIDGDGNIMWSRNYGKPGLDWLWKSQQTPDGGFISVGSASGNSFDRDILIIKTDADGLVAGCCIPKGQIIAENYTHSDIDVQFSVSPWTPSLPTNNQQVNANLQGIPYCGNQPIEIYHDITLCANEAFNLHGVDYYAPDDITEVLPGLFGCDTTVHYSLGLIPSITRSETITFCQGDSVNFHGHVYSAPDTVLINIPALNGCDTLVTYYFAYDTMPGNCLSCRGTFLKIIGDDGESVQGLGVYDTGDGNLYVTGTKQDSALLIKMTPSGSIIWSRTFDILPGVVDNIAEIIIDSDGMIAGCGQSGETQPIQAGFVFRYDPANNIMLWTRTINSGAPFVIGIMEKSPGGNYILNSNPQAPDDNAQFTEISRVTGDVVISPMSKTMDVGIADNFNSTMILNGKLYGVGRFTAGSQLIDMRHTVARFDVATGQMDYMNIGHKWAGPPARLYGMDFVIKSNSIISVGYGDENGDNLDLSKIFLYINNIDGITAGPIFRIDLHEIIGDAVDEIVSVPDGFVLLCHSLSTSPGDIYLVKLSELGIVQWSKKIDYNNEELLSISSVQSQILFRNGFLYCVATTTSATGEKRMMVVKISQDGKMDGGCDYVTDAPVTAELLQFSTGQTLVPVETPVSDNFGFLTVAVKNSNPGSKYFCRELAEDIVNITLCSGESVTLGGQVYSGPDTVVLTFTNTGVCDSIVTYIIQVLPKLEVFNDLGLCPNEAFNLHGIDYYAPGEVSDTLTGVFGCDSIIHYGLLLLPQPTRSVAISLCPGESVVIGGHSYTQPGTVADTIPAAMGCDTIVTYTITSPLPAPSVVSIHCPANISVIADPGTAPLVVNYDPPTAASNCPCPGVALTQTAGLPSGGAFPNGVTQVCYTAKDSCGYSASCCFTVTVREVQPCDVKVNGCIRYELLSITADPAHNLTYRIRVVNNCPNKLIYTAIQLPDAVVALAPNNLSVFTTESGREYDVRNPNFSPFYSIRFKSILDSISGGESDIFKFTLPAQSAPLYMDITSRLATQVFYEAHLNTFYCPIGITMNRSDDAAAVLQQGPLLFPNPTDGTLWVDLGDWGKAHFQWRIFNSQGQQIMADSGMANEELLRIEMTRGMPDGLFFFEIMHDNGQKETMRFVLQH